MIFKVSIIYNLHQKKVYTFVEPSTQNREIKRVTLCLWLLPLYAFRLVPLDFEYLAMT